MSFNISNLASFFSAVKKTTEPNRVTENKNLPQAPNGQEFATNLSSKQIDVLYTQVTHAAKGIMNHIEQNIFLRDMLGLPKEWSALLNEFALASNNTQLANMLKGLNANANSANAALLALLRSNAKVDLAALAAHLGTNSALMADKLLKHMGTANMSQENIAQLKQLMLIGASIANTAQTNPQEFIRDIIQMYLPWLPLVPPKEENLSEIEAKTQGAANENAQVLFYISSLHLGYFKVEILLANENEIFITNISEKTDEGLRDALVENLNAGIKKTSINAKIYFSKKTEEENPELKEKQLYIVRATESLVGLTLMQLLARLIFEFDEKQGQRFEKV